jgi:NADPH-dependent FMN reductase
VACPRWQDYVHDAPRAGREGGPAGASLAAAWFPAAGLLMLDDMDTNETSRPVIIVGSVREGRFGPTAASWAAGHAREHGGFDVDVVDLADADIPFALPTAPRSSPGTTIPGQKA